jgi:hypothetical protein
MMKENAKRLMRLMRILGAENFYSVTVSEFGVDLQGYRNPAIEEKIAKWPFIEYNCDDRTPIKRYGRKWCHIIMTGKTT